MIYHVTTAAAADAAARAGEYEPEAFTRDGFIHCAYREQVAGVLERYFAGRTDLVLLEIDPARLTCRVVDENLVGGSELFPHVYGRLPWSAVMDVVRLQPDTTVS